MITYVDTSVLIKLIIDEPGSDRAALVWDSAEQLATASITYAEARAALGAAHRAGRLTRAELVAANDSLSVLYAQMHIFAVDDALVHHAGELAQSDGLRGFDAVHLAAALRVKAVIVATGDQRMIDAALAHSIYVAAPLDIPAEAVLHVTGGGAAGV